jgi:hypothetical protein
MGLPGIDSDVLRLGMAVLPEMLALVTLEMRIGVDSSE